MSALLAALQSAEFSNLGRLYVGPGLFHQVSPLAYAAIMAGGAAWLGGCAWTAWRLVSARPDARRAGKAAFGWFLATGLYVTLVYPPTTDEPHYLVIAESLLKDGDIEVGDQYRDGSWRKFFHGESIDPHAVIVPGGRMYSQHTAGLPLLVLPGYALAGRWGTTVILAAVAASLIAGLFALCAETGAPRRRAAAVAALAAGTGPALFGSTLMFTEVAAAALLAWALLRRREAWAPAALAAAMPWLHPRYAALAAGVAAVAWLAAADRRRWTLAWGTCLALSGGAFFTVYHGPALAAVLNTVTERYPARIEELTTGSLSASALGNPLTALAGKLFDGGFGAVPYAPWLLLLVPGALGARAREPARRFLAGGAAYLALTLVFRNWWGSAYPGRTLLPLLPFAAPFLAQGLAWASRGGARRVAAAAAVAASLAGAWAMTACPVLRYTSGREWIEGFAPPLAWALPETWFPSLAGAPASLAQPQWLTVLAACGAVTWLVRRR